MTTKINKSWLLSITALITCLYAPVEAVTYAETYDEALSKAGKDGILIYCYGPDWNARSLRMLKSFWRNNPDLEKAAGDAVLLSVPFYQDPESKGAEREQEIRGNMPEPKSRICPSVLMLDGNGRLYHSLLAGDGLIENKEEQILDKLRGTLTHPEDYVPVDAQDGEKGKLGIRNITKYLGLHRRQLALMEKAAGITGEEKAKYITEACELGIAPPENAEEIIRSCDPLDSGGYLKRMNYKPRKFMDIQFEVVDGAIPDDFVEDPLEIQKDVAKIVADEHLKPTDRQDAYNLLIGSFRRAGEGGSKLTGIMRQSTMLDDKSYYSMAYIALAKKWGGPGTRPSKEDRDKLKEKRKEKEKLKKESKIRDRRAESNFTIE